MMGDLTELIGRAREGDRAASDRLFAAVYQDLHRIAARQLRGDDAMRTTSLVHEAYERLARPEALALRDREHFFAVAGRAMRQIVIDHVRERVAGKRGGGAAPASLDDDALAVAAAGDPEQLLALDAALDALARHEPRLAQLVELRFFGGLDLEDAGAVLGLSATTLKRDFRRARAFLHAALAESPR